VIFNDIARDSQWPKAVMGNWHWSQVKKTIEPAKSRFSG